MKDINYDLELERAKNYILTHNVNSVCLQLPDGLKPYAKDIVDYLNKNTTAEIIIWGESCYGACDLPIGLDKMNVDLIIQWGHAPWKF